MAEPEEISLITEIERLAAAEPFEAFSIVMASGERYNLNGNRCRWLRQELALCLAVPPGSMLAATEPDQ